MKRRSFQVTMVGLILLLLLVSTLSFSLGTLALSPLEILKTLIGRGTQQQELALFVIRLPRILIALLVGAALAVSGTILQSVVDNDLAEPGILGINSGAALFVVIYIYLTNGNNYYSMPDFTIFTMPFIALSGGLVAAVLIYGLAWKQGMNSMRLLLMGIAVNVAFTSLIIIMQLRFNNQDFNRVLMWTSGSLWGTSWIYVGVAAPVIIALIAITIYGSRYLDVLRMGEMTAIGLGVNVLKAQRYLIFIAVALAAVATSVAGNISFVGLMAPHISRKLVGARHQYLTVTAMLVGMILVVAADMIARNLFAPIELFIGAVISVIGTPYFIYLMLKQDHYE